MKLSQLGEFGLIKNARDIFKSLNENIVVGIGDDCAAIKLRKGFLLITTTDALVEGIHFKLDYIEPYQLGIKSININLSDIAAMGGIPLYALLSIAAPPNFSVKFMGEFFKGIKDGAKRYKVSIIGGNVSSSKNELSINITILGEVEKKYMVLRNGAKAGDKIFVTGWLGDSAAGLAILKKGQGARGKGQEKLINKHLMPIPRLTEGRFLAVKKLATSMIDISDGLASDIRRICEESNVGANIFTKNIPISRELKSEIRNPKSEINLALYGGEDYELLFAVKPEKAGKLKSLWEDMKIPITMIGEITKRGINLVNTDGKAIPLTKEGYNHFKG
ncbi:MAG: thiamine-phosphate kinase [Nitrospinae bacterium]|nr:thiamine-phosphate kinase [Nitrospinota bacterium]